MFAGASSVSAEEGVTDPDANPENGTEESAETDPVLYSDSVTISNDAEVQANEELKSNLADELQSSKEQAISEVKNLFLDIDSEQAPHTLEEYVNKVNAAVSQEGIVAIVDEVRGVLDHLSENESIDVENDTEPEQDKLEISGENVSAPVESNIEKSLTEEEIKNATISAENWDEDIAAENNYWKLPDGWKGRNIGGVRGTGAALSEVNYLGTYTDENGRDVLRLQWKGDIGASATYLNRTSLAFKFDQNLYEKIDWDRSFGVSARDKESKFQFQNVNKRDYQAELSLADMTDSYTGALYQLPINLVLNEGIKLADLSGRDYLIQHRAIEPTNKFVWTNVPGTLRDVDLNEIEYNQYTKSTVIPFDSNLKNQVIPSGVQNNDHVRLSYGTSQYDSAKKTLRVDLKYRKRDSSKYGGNFGLVQSFDARLLDLLEEDEFGNVAYVNVLDTGNDKAYSNVAPIGISKEQINVQDGVATIYVVGQDFQSNIDESGIKVVRTSRGSRTDGVESVIDGAVTINYVATSIEYKVNEDAISKLFPENKYLDSYAFYTGLIRDNPDGLYRSDQKAEQDVVIEDGGKLTLDFENQNKAGRGFILKIGNTEHQMEAVGPKRVDEYETLQYRNTGSLINTDYVYDIVFQSGRTIKAGDDITLWVLNGEDRELVEGGWRLFLNTGNPGTDMDVVKVDSNQELAIDYNPFYLNNSRSVDGVMITKYKYVPQVEDIYDKGIETTENNSNLKEFEGITGTVRKEANDVTAYYILPDGSKYYVKFTQAAGPGEGRPIILDQEGKEVEEGSREYNDVYDYLVKELAYGQETDEEGNVTVEGDKLVLKKDMEIYVNNSSEGQFPSDPVVEKVKARVIFDQNYEGKPADKVVEAPENEQALGTAGYQANGLDYNGTNVMPEDPTREGKTFVGWATTPDATEANFTKDTPITESIKVYAVWKDVEIADNYEPSYEDKVAKVGEEVTSPISFTDKEGQPATPEATYTLGEGAPQGAAVDADGNVTYTPVEGDANTTVTIPVFVTYTDGSTDTADAVINVGEVEKLTTVDNSNVTPVEPTDEEQGTGIIITNKDEDTTITATDEDGKDIQVTVDPETGEVKVTPGTDVDGPIKVKVEDPDLDAPVETDVPVKGHEAGQDDNGSDLREKDIYKVTTKVVEKEFGEPTTREDIENAISVEGYPEENPNKPSVHLYEGDLPDGKTSGTFKVPAKVVFPDGSLKEVEVTVKVAEEPSDKLNKYYFNVKFDDGTKEFTTILEDSAATGADKQFNEWFVENYPGYELTLDSVDGNRFNYKASKKVEEEPEDPSDQLNKYYFNVKFDDGTKEFTTILKDSAATGADGRFNEWFVKNYPGYELTLESVDGNRFNYKASKKVEAESGDPAVAYPVESHPIVKKVGEKLTEKEVTDAIKVVGLDENQYTVTINDDQNLPSTDEAGDFVVDVTINYNDGTTQDAQVWIIVEDKEDSGTDQPGGDDSGSDQGGTDTPGTDQPGGDDSGSDQGGTDTPGTDQPGGDDSGSDQGGTDTPGTDQPGGDDSGSDQGGTDTPGTDQPGGDDSGSDQGGTDTPGTDQPGGDDSGSGQGGKVTPGSEQSPDNAGSGAKSKDQQGQTDEKVSENKELPQTGVESYGLFGSAALSVLAGLGLIKKKEDEK